MEKRDINSKELVIEEITASCYDCDWKVNGSVTVDDEDRRVVTMNSGIITPCRQHHIESKNNMTTKAIQHNRFLLENDIFRGFIAVSSDASSGMIASKKECEALFKNNTKKYETING